MLLGIAVFYFDTAIVPTWYEGGYGYAHAYAHLGDSLLQVLLSPFTQPLTVLQHLFQENRIRVVFGLLLPLAFLPLFNWRAAVAVLPPLLAHFLSQHEQRISLGYHYAADWAVALFWSLPGAMAWITRRQPQTWDLKKLPQIHWQPAVSAGLVAVFLFGSFGRSDQYFIRRYQPDAHHRWLRTRALPCLQPDLAVAAPNAIVPHISDRPWASLLRKSFQDPSLQTPVDCFLHHAAMPLPGPESQRLRTALAEGVIRQEYSCQGFTVYRRSGSEKSCLRCQPECPN